MAGAGSRSLSRGISLLPPAGLPRGAHNRRTHLFQPEGNTMTSRRQFIALVPLFGAAALAHADAPLPLVDPKSPQAQQLGYLPDASKADKAKSPKYAAGQACSGCALFQGKVGDASGPCPLYPGKAVLAKAWCNAFVART
jgi:hypothetical protein